MMNLCKSFLGFSEVPKTANDDYDGGDGGGRGGGRWGFSFSKEGSGGGGDVKKLMSLHCSRFLPCHVSTSTGLSLIAAEVEKPQNVLESSALRPLAEATTLPPPPRPLFHQNDNFGWGLQHCTEGLGFESSDETEPSSSGEPREADVDSEVARRERIYLEKRSKRKMISRQRLRSELPPPLPWLSTKGHPSFFLRPQRRDGRIIMTEMRINHHDVFLASRHGGRLTLQLVGKPPYATTTATISSSGDLDNENEAHGEQKQEAEECESPEKPLHAIESNAPNEEKNAGGEGKQEKQEVQGEGTASKCLGASITVPSIVRAKGQEQEAQECEKQEDNCLDEYEEIKKQEKSDSFMSDNRNLLPALSGGGGNGQGSWRCYDRGELDYFWSHRYVTTT